MRITTHSESTTSRPQPPPPHEDYNEDDADADANTCHHYATATPPRTQPGTPALPCQNTPTAHPAFASSANFVRPRRLKPPRAPCKCAVSTTSGQANFEILGLGSQQHGQANIYIHVQVWHCWHGYMLSEHEGYSYFNYDHPSLSWFAPIIFRPFETLPDHYPTPDTPNRKPHSVHSQGPSFGVQCRMICAMARGSLRGSGRRLTVAHTLVAVFLEAFPS